MTINIRKLSVAETLELFPVAPVPNPKEEAMARVARNTPPSWLKIARAAVTTVAMHNTFFTTDDVWDEIERSGWTGKLERRAMGPVMKWAQAEHMCEIANVKYPTSRRAECHYRPIPLYRSLIEPAGPF